ncbi:hypothetical protein GCM10009785_24150 [Brooklawnia cerclae]
MLRRSDRGLADYARRSRHERKFVLRMGRLTAVAACLILLAGCAANSSQDSGLSAPVSAGATTILQADLDAREEALAQFAEAFDLTDVPDVEIVRWIDPSEHVPVIVDCLNEAGYPAQVDES